MLANFLPKKLKTQSRYVVQIEVSFVSTRRNSDTPEKINISILSVAVAYEHCVTIKHFRFGDKIETSLNLFSLFISRGLSFRDLRLGVMKTQTPGNK